MVTGGCIMVTGGCISTLKPLNAGGFHTTGLLILSKH